MNSILGRYIFREITVPYGLSLLGLVSLLLLQRLIQITDWVVNRGISLKHMFTMVGLLLPFFMVIIIPISVLLATLLAVNRLSSDNEITAAKAGGISLWSLFPPVLAMGVLNMALTGFLSLYIVPKATDYTGELLFKIARSNARAALRAKKFRELAPGLMVYVDAINGDTLQGILISEKGTKRTFGANNTDEVYVIASEGSLLSDPHNRANYLALKNGNIHVTDNEGDVYRKIEFNRFNMKLEIERNDKGKIERGSQFDVMDTATLRAKNLEYERKYKEAAGSPDAESRLKAGIYRAALAQIGIAYHQKFSLPVACIILALWGIPLGIQPPRATRYQGIAVSVVLCLSYYLLVSGGKVMATKLGMTPAIAAWLPNGLVLATGLLFCHRVARDRSIPLADAIGRVGEWAGALSDKIGRRGGA